MLNSNNSEVNIDMTPEPATGDSSIGILQRWKREDSLKRFSLGLRGVALFFSLISFLLMASNNHGDWENFDNYQEYRYLLAVSIFTSLYTGCQVYRQVHELSTGNNIFRPTMAAVVDFVGDQGIAYLLISSASTAIPLTDRMREGGDTVFTDSASATITMSFFSFIFLALSAIISGYKLSSHT
ncbi:CASP-like protein 4B1 [Trifolium pratense]|uniref:CASP-like protein 4B1 n=1 Tax=Trifolium pratense TaxID=57577 RepID=UPI001E697C00|nr:CASP-like protein 4B1 [Trifolium pratense]